MTTHALDMGMKHYHAAEIRRCLLECDHLALQKLWNAFAPVIGINRESDARFTLHLARTGAESIPLAKRKYSARWLEERGFGAFVPEQLKPPRKRINSAHVQFLHI